MDIDITTVITTLATLLCGGGGTALFFRKQSKRNKELENDKMASESWRELYEQERKAHTDEVTALRAEHRQDMSDTRQHWEESVERKQSHIKDLRDQNDSLMAHLRTSQEELAHAHYNECMRNCKQREPPRKERSYFAPDDDSDTPDTDNADDTQ